MAGNALCADIAMLGTFSVWRLGSLQARALPLARALYEQTGLRAAIITTPWDLPAEAGTLELNGPTLVINTAATSPRATPLAVRQQLQWVARLRARAVHIFKPRGFGGIAGALTKRRNPALPLLVDSDDWEGDGGWNQRNDYGVLQRRLFDWQERSLLARADHVTAASTLLADRARALRSHPDSVTLLPNGLERDWIERLRAARRAAVEPDRPTILLYSRFAEFPADWLGRFACALAAHSCQPVRLSLIGDVPAGQIPPSQPGVEVDVHGFVARDKLPALLTTSSIAVYPYEDNLINRSKQSVKLLELMAAGCPVLASDVGEAGGTLGGAGCVLSGADPVVFAQASLALLDQPRRLAGMANQAQRRVLERFEIDHLAQKLAAVYQRLGIVGPC